MSAQAGHSLCAGGFKVLRLKVVRVQGLGLQKGQLLACGCRPPRGGGWPLFGLRVQAGCGLRVEGWGLRELREDQRVQRRVRFQDFRELRESGVELCEGRGPLRFQGVGGWGSRRTESSIGSPGAPRHRSGSLCGLPVGRLRAGRMCEGGNSKKHTTVQFLSGGLIDATPSSHALPASGPKLLR